MMSSSSPIGRIEVRSSSPGITSASQAAAADRDWPAIPPIATIIASAAVNAPTVNAVRLRSRARAARARRSSRRRTSENGRPARRASGSWTYGASSVMARSRT